jgi:TPR repeat protein
MGMNRTFTAAVAALMLAVSFAGSVAAGPVEDAAAAVAAHKRGDYATALRLIRPLADQGDADARNILGLMYYSGQGVPQDYVIAHMWLSLAAAGGNFTAERDFIAAKMTPAQIAEAQKLAREWKPTTGR